MMPLLDIQRKGRQLGRIRIGVQIDTGKTSKTGRKIYRPEKLETFRFTTHSRTAADAVAALLGGQVRPWEPEGQVAQWEVITSATELPVMVPPGDLAISQWYEMWSGGGCQRRCDGFTEQITRRPCLCPHASDPNDPDEVEEAARDRADLAAQNPPGACKPTTRLNVMLPDLPDIGVWRLDSHGFYSAVELGGAAELLAKARAAGTVLPATLRLEQRQVKRGGKTKKFAVPVLEVGASLRQLTAGTVPSLADALPPTPRAVAALESGPRPGGDKTVAAQEVAAKAHAAKSAQEVADLGVAARAAGLLEQPVTVGNDRGSLEAYLLARHTALKAAAPPVGPHEFVYGDDSDTCGAEGCGRYVNDDVHPEAKEVAS